MQVWRVLTESAQCPVFATAVIPHIVPTYGLCWRAASWGSADRSLHRLVEQVRRHWVSGGNSSAKSAVRIKAAAIDRASLGWISKRMLGSSWPVSG